jgi:PKD repeat protein
MLQAVFVAPSAVNQGDEVQLDGSASASTLQIAPTKYVWDFGDGSAKVVGPSVVHTYSTAGTYVVTLTVTDRGGNQSAYSQTLTVLTANGQPAPPPGSAGGGSGGGSGSGGSGGGTVQVPFRVHVQLLPEALRNVLNHGLALRVNSNYVANGLVTVSISRQSARAAHITVGRALTVVIGRGTVSQVRNGSITLHLHLSPKMAAKLHRLRHLTVTVRLALVPSVGHRLAIVVAGRY